ncbi:MAG: amino acid ABC transporter permease [Arenicellales bacterium]
MSNKNPNKMGVVNLLPLPELAPPGNTVGAVGWMKNNLFSSPLNSILTLLGLALLYILIPPVLNWTMFDAVWSGGSEACKANPDAACWTFAGEWWEFFIYGFYDKTQRWRVDLVLWALYVWVAFIIPENESRATRPTSTILGFVIAGLSVLFISMAIKHNIPTMWLLIGAMVVIGTVLWAWGLKNGRSRVGIIVLVLFPIIAYFLLGGGTLGLSVVNTNDWGGFLLTLVIAITGIVASLPLGVLLALGRRSEMPVLRMVSTLFIEFWRGVPLITVLFMASFMLPLFMSKGVTIDQLLRALIGVALFSSAYMAEVIRGGLQAIPKGQYEGAQSLGLSFWKMMGLIVMPQALKIVIPGIVSTFIGLFKDTTLVLIIGLLDFLNSVQTATTNPEWSIKSVPYTGYVLVALVFWVHCYGMAWYSRHLENKLDTGHKR